MSRILVTGSHGLIGHHLCAALEAAGYDVVRFDLRNCSRGGPTQDVTNRDAVLRALPGCRGVVHLAAVSRVPWGERYPDWCRGTNIGGTRIVLEASTMSAERPWIIFASSREVYGQPVKLPVDEDAEYAPINTYGRTKVAGERLTASAIAHGLRTAICRFSNVYGWLDDYSDRVVPAFARAAAEGGTLHVEGGGNTFDFTHISDVILGLVRLVVLMNDGDCPPPIQFVSGRGTSLADLARLATRVAQKSASVVDAPSREYDVNRFVGSPEKVKRLLGWVSRVPIEQGITDMVRGYERLQQGVTASAPESI